MKKILIVEDDMILMMINKKYVQSLGHHVIAAVTDGESAIKAAQEYSPDYILMDIRIEGPLDGIETAEKINEFSKIPIIYISGNSDPITKERAQKTNMCGFFIKPISAELLKSVIV